MIQNARIISCYSADTSGVCSAMYELGGMTVVHDASGCNSTYSTHDEPRWYDMDSMIFISALSEYDAIYGNDEKLICDITDTAKELSPKFISICGSPMPAMIGTDFDAVAQEVERRTNIKTFGLHTNGMHSYQLGAGEAFTAFLKAFCGERVARATPHNTFFADIENLSMPYSRAFQYQQNVAYDFVRYCPEKNKIRVNLLGVTPLDFSINSTVSSMKKWVLENGFELNCCMAMGSTFEEVSNAQNCDCNLVVSHSGLSSAEFLWEKYKIPFVVGVPIGDKFSKILSQNILKAVDENRNIFPCQNTNNSDYMVTVIGESVFSSSLARAIECDFGIGVRTICMLEADDRTLGGNDKIIPFEVQLEKELSDCEIVVADRMFKPICNENTKFYSLCHEAFSGRCYSKTIPDLIGKKLNQLTMDS